MRIKKCFLLHILTVLVIAMFFCDVLAQELPPINTFTPQQYGGENQNWAISQAKDKTIYIANNVGLLEYNGAKWTRYDSPNETILRSVKVVGDRIYAGCYMEFGFWTRNTLGILEYTSLSNHPSLSLIEDEQFWQITTLDDWILFNSLDRIYICNTKDSSFKVIESKSAITKLFKVDGSIYFQDIDYGVFKIENGEKSIFIDDAVVKENILVNIFSYQNKKLLQTQNNGFYVFDGEQLEPWDIDSKALLSKVCVYSSIKLKDGSFALGTISDGLILLDSKGRLEHQINQGLGLSNNTVLSLFEDVENNMWLGLDNGINCINSKSPIKIFNDSKGNLGSVYASAIFKDKLYLGTNQGLFYKGLDGNEGFTFVNGTQGQVWCLETIRDELFCGHNTGTFIIEGNKAKKVSSVQGTWSIKPIDGKANALLQGNYNGLNILEKKEDGWSFKNKIEGFDISSRFFELANNNQIFINHEYKGVFKITIDDAFTQATKVEIDSSLSRGLHSSLLKYNDDIYFAYKEGVYKYEFGEGTFKKDSIFSQIFSPKDYSSGKLIKNNESDKLWGFSETDVTYVTPGKLSNEPEINRIALPSNLRKGVTSYENIIHLKDEKYLFGTSSGYLVIDLSKVQRTSHHITLNTIVSSGLNAKTKQLDKDSHIDLKTNENNVEFTFSTPQFNKYQVAEYQHQLLGIYDEWSEWTTTPNVRYKNLPYGNYTFNVRARVGANISLNTESYQFGIGKPWYLSNAAIVVYVLVFLLFSLLMHNIYKRYYKRQREKLLSKTKRELELKELENKQQLMSFENEKLQQDIDGKNRELAISTMSLIKKNEFLNDIKKELKAVNTNNNLKTVIKIIDKNINNTDDWKFFQEAFNNADKDFLKKIKAKHGALTPNDLKLCAYLRLNLSSKEIAPLLNISPRSVEVKRYRLRKKMNLSHKDSLTNYILDI